MDAPNTALKATRPCDYRHADTSPLPLTVVLVTKPRPDKGFVEAVATQDHQAVHRGGSSAAVAVLRPEQEERRCGQRRQRDADGLEARRVMADEGKQDVDGRSPERMRRTGVT